MRTKRGGFVFGFRDLVGLQGKRFIFGALYPSKSGLVNKRVVKHSTAQPH